MDTVSFRCDSGLLLPGLHPDAIRAAVGVFRLMEESLGQDEAMAHAVWTFLGWMERWDPDDLLAVVNREALAKHERRLLAAGRGRPDEVLDQLMGK